MRSCTIIATVRPAGKPLNCTEIRIRICNAIRYTEFNSDVVVFEQHSGETSGGGKSRAEAWTPSRVPDHGLANTLSDSAR